MARTRSGTHPNRVREAAEALLNRGMRPTVQRVRAMLGGGSPNIIAPILKDWRETLTPEQQLRLPLAEIHSRRPELPLVISDLAAELWKRAIVFATIECKGSPQALQLATSSEEAELLRAHNASLLDDIEKVTADNLALREQMAELQAVANVAIKRASECELRYSGVVSQLQNATQSLRRSRRTMAAKRKVSNAVTASQLSSRRSKVSDASQKKKFMKGRSAFRMANNRRKNDARSRG